MLTFDPTETGSIVQKYRCSSSNYQGDTHTRFSSMAAFNCFLTDWCSLPSREEVTELSLEVIAEPAMETDLVLRFVRLSSKLPTRVAVSEHRDDTPESSSKHGMNVLVKYLGRQRTEPC